MQVYMSGRYWPFIIVFGYALRDLTVNLVSNDLSIGLDRKSSVIQRIIIYVAMLIVAIFCSTVIKSLQQQQCSHGEVVTSDRHIVDILSPEAEHAHLAHLTLVTTQVIEQLEASLSQRITQIQARYESGNLSHTEVPSRCAGIIEPEALGRTEDLSKTRVHSQPPQIFEPHVLPGTQDLLQGDDLPLTQVVPPSSNIPEPQSLLQNEALLRVEDLLQTGARSSSLDILTLQVSPQAGALPRGDLPLTEVLFRSPDIRELQALSQIEDLPLAEELPRTEDQPQHTGGILENLFPPHYSTFQEGSARIRTRNIIELYRGKGKSTIGSFLEVKAWTDMKTVELFEIKVIKIHEGYLGASPESPDQEPSRSPRGPLDPEVAAMFSEDLDY